VAAMLKVQANKKLLQQQVMEDTGNIVLLKDLHNIAARVVPKKDVQSVVETLSAAPGRYGCPSHWLYFNFIFYLQELMLS
jgi:hypothetical protein